MTYTVTALALAVSLLLLGGCGQMGPLYYPPKEQAPQSEPVQPADDNQQQSDT